MHSGLKIAIAWLCLGAPALAADFDLAIRHALIVDGSGQDPVTGDVLGRGIAIAFIGKLSGEAKAAGTINDHRRVLAP